MTLDELKARLSGTAAPSGSSTQFATEWRTIGAVNHHGGTPVEIKDGKIAKGPPTLVDAPVPHAAKDDVDRMADPFDGDSRRAAARSYAEDVNQRIAQGRSDAKDASRRYVAHANAEYGRLQSQRPVLPDSASDEEYESRYAANESDAKAAVTHAHRALSKDHSDAMESSRSGHESILSDMTGEGRLEHGDTEDFRDEVRSRESMQIPIDAVQHVHPQHQNYIRSHADRIGEALNDRGRLHAERVFSENDAGVKAIPSSLGKRVLDGANRQYADAIKAMPQANEDDEDGGKGDSDHRRILADAAVRESSRSLKGTARQRVLDDADSLADELVENGSITHDFFNRDD